MNSRSLRKVKMKTSAVGTMGGPGAGQGGPGEVHGWAVGVRVNVNLGGSLRRW